MSILWIYDKPIDPESGGTERATDLVMGALSNHGYRIAGALHFCQDAPRDIYGPAGQRVEDLYAFLQENDVRIVINQIGFSRWLLDEFFERDGQKWKDEGGRIITCLHFDPMMFPTTLRVLVRHWQRRSLRLKMRRLGRIIMLPIENLRHAKTLRKDYAYLISRSDSYVILSEKHRRSLCDISRTQQPEKIHAIPNLNTFTTSLAKEDVALKDKTVLIVSRLDEPQKRISLALEAWARVMKTGTFDDWTLKIVGDGEYAQDYREMVAQNRIRNVEFIGPSNPECYYDQARLYLHTARREGWGLTITEAMQKGAVPIVMNSCAVFEDLIADGQTGILVTAGDVKAFAAHITDLMRDDARRERMARAAIVASERHDLAHVVQMWRTLLDGSSLDAPAAHPPKP